MTGSQRAGTALNEDARSALYERKDFLEGQ
jgi:hypothetical protein